MSVLPKLIYIFSAIPINIPTDCFVEISKIILQLTQREKRPRKTITIVKEKNKGGRLTLLNFKLYCSGTEFKAE
jgi:hypothetical protein